MEQKICQKSQGGTDLIFWKGKEYSIKYGIENGHISRK